MCINGFLKNGSRLASIIGLGECPHCSALVLFLIDKDITHFASIISMSPDVIKNELKMYGRPNRGSTIFILLFSRSPRGGISDLPVPPTSPILEVHVERLLFLGIRTVKELGNQTNFSAKSPCN